MIASYETETYYFNSTLEEDNTMSLQNNFRLFLVLLLTVYFCSQLYNAFGNFLAREITTTVKNIPRTENPFFPSMTFCPKSARSEWLGFNSKNLTDIYLNDPPSVGYLKSLVHRYGQG